MLLIATDVIPLPGSTAVGFTVAFALTRPLIVGLLYPVLPRAYRNPRWGSWLFLGLASTTIPVVGSLGVALVFGIVPRLRRPKRRVRRYPIDVPELETQRAQTEPAMPWGEGGLLGVVRFAADPSRRVRAVLATQQMRNREAITILRTALKDPVDDVRLLAHSFLDRMEYTINGKIKTHLDDLAGLEESENVELRTATRHKLAREYWELAYLNLVEGDVRNHILASARTHAEASLEEREENPSLHFLLARIRLEQGDLEGSETALRAAEHAGLAISLTLPYQAEIEFGRWNFRGVQEALEHLPPIRKSTPPLREVARYWGALEEAV